MIKYTLKAVETQQKNEKILYRIKYKQKRE